MQNLAILFTGFSLFYLPVFTLTHFQDDYKNKKIARFFGILLMGCLALLQFLHFNYLTKQTATVVSVFYLCVLLLIAPSFYFFARPVLQAKDDFRWLYLLHFTPLLLIFACNKNMVFSLAFIIGSLYLMWLVKTIYALRTHKKQFKYEIILLSMVFIIAFAVSFVALLMPFSQQLFYAFYASAIGLALLIVALVVSNKPQITDTVSQAAIETYAVSTLKAIDCEAKLRELEQLMQEDNLYQQRNLDRQTIAHQLDLSNHQLSELCNTKLGLGFSQYLRQQRINAAKKLLLAQPNASVLSISLEVGFSSQSNFYEAFKDLVGTTPAKYRKNLLSPKQ